jgi:organic radical activating enzyme
MTVEQIIQKVTTLVPKSTDRRTTVVITGGEPCYQLKELRDLTSSLLFDVGARVHIETNGDVKLHRDFEQDTWLTVSPKGPEWVQRAGSELKVVYTGQSSDELNEYLKYDFENFFLQPCSTPEGSNVREVVEIIKLEPRWRLSLQTHKLIGVK